MEQKIYLDKLQDTAEKIVEDSKFLKEVNLQLYIETRHLAAKIFYYTLTVKKIKENK